MKSRRYPSEAAAKDGNVRRRHSSSLRRVEQIVNVREKPFVWWNESLGVDLGHSNSRMIRAQEVNV